MFAYYPNRYEDMVKNRTSVINQVLAFLNVSHVFADNMEFQQQMQAGYHSFKRYGKGIFNNFAQVQFKSVLHSLVSYISLQHFLIYIG